jgi:hypothetical protein
MAPGLTPAFGASLLPAQLRTRYRAFGPTSRRRSKLTSHREPCTDCRSQHFLGTGHGTGHGTARQNPGSRRSHQALVRSWRSLRQEVIPAAKQIFGSLRKTDTRSDQPSAPAISDEEVRLSLRQNHPTFWFRYAGSGKAGALIATDPECHRECLPDSKHILDLQVICTDNL